MNEADTQEAPLHIVTSRIALLTSKSGRNYIGCDVPHHEVEPYLRELAVEEPTDFYAIRRNQSVRDRGHFHVTVVSPPEFERIADAVPEDVVGESIRLILSGLGRAVRGGHRSFFVVVQCEKIAQLRHSLGLGNRDLHITLGFDRDDVHDISKDRTTLI